MFMKNNAVKGYLCVAAAAVMWASSGTAGKALFLQGVSPFDLVQIRVTLSALLLAAYFVLYQRPLMKIRVRDVGFFLLLGAVAMAFVQVTYFYAISKIQVAAAILLQYLAPIFVSVFSFCFWKEKPTLVKIVAIFLSFTGCYLVVGGYDLSILQMNRLGVLSGLGSAVCFASYTLLGERAMYRYSPWTVLFYSLLFSALTWHLIYPPFRYLWAGFSMGQWAWFCYIAALGTVIPFGLFFLGVNHIRSTRASITGTLEPISAGFIAFVTLGEVLETLQILGGVLVIMAIVLLQLHREQHVMTPELIRAGRATGER